MGSFDRQVRNEAVTMRANVFGHNYMDETEYDLTAGAITLGGGGYSDLCPLLGIDTTTFNNVAPYPSAVNVIRVLQPHQGELVECYIDFIMVRYVTTDGYAEPKGGNSMSIAIGDFINNDFMTPRTSYTTDELKASWKRISGLDSGITRKPGDEAVTYASRVNLLPELKKAGNAKFVEDGFNLLLVFNDGMGAPIGSIGSGFDFGLTSLRIVQSMTGVR